MMATAGSNASWRLIVDTSEEETDWGGRLLV